MGDSWKKVVVDELHRPARKNFPRRQVQVRGIDETWTIDLVDMQKYSHFNKGYNYLMTVIDNLSKFAWALPLKNKTGLEVHNALKSLFAKGRKPKNFHVDQGSEFYNSNVKGLLHKEGINLYSTFSEKKASIIERFNRTLKTKMWKKFSLRGNYKWTDILQDLMNEYNKSEHRTIGMAPKDVTHDDEKRLIKMIHGRSRFSTDRPKFKVNNHVRISKYKSIFEKGYTPNWGTEIFKIASVENTSPITYKLKDYQDQPINGGFYKYELQKVKFPNIYLVEKILRRRKNIFKVARF